MTGCHIRSNLFLAERETKTMANPERTDSSTELATMVAQDARLQEQIKKDPVGTLERLAEPLESDPWIYRIVVLSLGFAAVGVVVGVIVLKALDRTTAIPDALVAIGSAAVAAMAALLVPGGRR
jgi:hypothetical protein